MLFTNNVTALAHSTVAGNIATSGEAGGIFLNSEVFFHNSILSGNLGDPGKESCLTDSGTPISRGFNLESSDSCDLGATGDQVSTDPLLVPLAANGGPTRTHAFLSTSPAIDQGASAACPVTDQRGVDRPVGAGCDIGAFETLACQPLVLEDHTIESIVTYEACESIIVRDLTFGGAADADLAAGGLLVLDSGVVIEDGATVALSIDPSLGVATP